MILPPELVNLRGCIQGFTGMYGKGNCFHRSAALVLDLPGSVVAMGVFRAATKEEAEQVYRSTGQRASTEPFVHCWVEHGEWALAPTTIERVGELVRMPREAYYAANEARDIRRVGRAQILKLDREAGLHDYFVNRKPLLVQRAVGEMLLDLAHIPYDISLDGGVIPKRK